MLTPLTTALGNCQLLAANIDGARKTYCIGLSGSQALYREV